MGKTASLNELNSKAISERRSEMTDELFGFILNDIYMAGFNDGINEGRCNNDDCACCENKPVWAKAPIKEKDNISPNAAEMGERELVVYNALINILMDGDYEVNCGTKIYKNGEPLNTHDVMDIAMKIFEAGMNSKGTPLIKSENMNESDTDLISSLYEYKRKGYVVIFNGEGFLKAKIEDFVKQGADGILYDLNRDFCTTVTLMKEKDTENLPRIRLINDFAAAYVIEYLRNQMKEQ